MGTQPAADSGAMMGGSGVPQRQATIKDGDWACPQCNFNNFSCRVNCKGCNYLKEGMKQGDWICRVCKTHNYARNMSCHRCQAPRQDGKGGGKGMGVMDGSGGLTLPNGLIIYANGVIGGSLGGAPQQQMGGPPMGAPMGQPMGKGGKEFTMKEGDWICSMCNNHNFATRASCNKCGDLRPGYAQGDWICRACKNHNFAGGDACDKCGNRKESSPNAWGAPGGPPRHAVVVLPPNTQGPALVPW